MPEKLPRKERKALAEKNRLELKEYLLNMLAKERAKHDSWEKAITNVNTYIIVQAKKKPTEAHLYTAVSASITREMVVNRESFTAELVARAATFSLVLKK